MRWRAFTNIKETFGVHQIVPTIFHLEKDFIRYGNIIKIL